jgi:hypothetical protein
MVITDERLDKAMTLLATTDLECAERKASVMRTKWLAEHTEALVYKALGKEGSVEDRKQSVQLDERVGKAWEEHFKAVVGFEALKAQRERNILVVELWRTVQANRRVGNVQ